MTKVIGPSIAGESPEVPAPRIHWPGAQIDLTTFPSEDVLHTRRRQSPQLRSPLLAFVDAVEAANQRVWLLDPYFGSPESHETNGALPVPGRLVEAFWNTNARTLRFVTRPHDGGLERLIREEPRLSRRFEWLVMRNQHAFPYAHDRFAIVDGELWHFGGTVGGGHGGLTAMTRGWSAKATGAADFFSIVWDRLGGAR